ncbi:MAG: hypothetical protein IPG23_22305 [Burkholderiales bacterium]|nr:hypothetical protein [Burkholderiales bacterium]
MNRTTRYVALGTLALTIAVHAVPVPAQVLRDPTIAPGEADAPTGSSPAGLDGMSVVVRDGRPFLVVGTRLYAPGDRFGAMRVERISETEVVLHDGNGRVRVPRFTGTERRTVVDSVNCKPAKPAKPATAPKPARASSAASAKAPLSINPPRDRARPKSSPGVGAPCEDRPS